MDGGGYSGILPSQARSRQKDCGGHGWFISRSFSFSAYCSTSGCFDFNGHCWHLSFGSATRHYHRYSCTLGSAIYHRHSSSCIFAWVLHRLASCLGVGRWPFSTRVFADRSHTCPGRQLSLPTVAICGRLVMSRWPNKSPEPTADSALSSAFAVHVAHRRWLSFFR